jgi:hypothetical protein
LESSHLLCLRVKAIALIKLFRLQEAHSVIQKIQKINQESFIAKENPLFSTEDPEILLEQALSIDPFKTKPRLESLDTIKNQTSFFRSFRKLVMAERNHTIRGFAVLVGLIMAVSFFFRDQATYKSFSLLSLTLLLSVTGMTSAFSVITNTGVFFPPSFRKFLQRKDIVLAYRGLIVLCLIIVAFGIWHYTKSYVALVTAIVAAGYFSLIGEKFSDGKSLQGFSIPKPKSHNKSDVQKLQTKAIPLEEASYYALYQILRKKFPGSAQLPAFTLKLLKYGGIFLVTYPIIFMILRISSVAIDYPFLVIPEITVLFFCQFCWALLFIEDIPLFYPSHSRRFIPPGSRTNAYRIAVLEFLLLASLITWLTANNGHVLWISLALFTLILRAMFTSKKRESADGLSKEELIAHIKQYHPAFNNKYD